MTTAPAQPDAPLSPARRRALAGAVAAMLAPQVVWADDGTPDGRALAAFVDTLLPADALTPAASALGVPEAIADFAAGVPGLPELIAGGTAWLDRTGGPPFAELSAADRDRVVAWMEGSDPAQGPYRFYEVIRLLAVEFYYAAPEAVAGLPLNVAPQPRGYPPPWT